MSNILPKADLVTFVASDAGVTKAQAQAVLDALGPVVRVNAGNGYTISLPGLGRFSEKTRAPRTGRNPATGAEVEIPARPVLTFKPAKAAKAGA